MGLNLPDDAAEPCSQDSRVYMTQHAFLQICLKE